MTGTAAVPPINSLIRVENASHNSVCGAVNDSRADCASSLSWLSLSILPYRFQHDDPGTYPRRWETVSRTTRPSTSKSDAVVVLGILRLIDGPRLLLVKQFRPPVRSVSVELPAGLVEDGESPEEAGIRELREETGFVGVVRRVHPPASLSPGMSTELVTLVEVDIEGEVRRQQLDPGENIEVISVPLNRLEEALKHMAEQGITVKHAVSTLAVGLRLGRYALKE